MTAHPPSDQAAEAESALREEIEDRIALLYNPMPDMSGRQINRLHGENRRRVQDLAAEIASRFAAVRTRAEELQGLLATHEICADKLKAENASLRRLMSENMVIEVVEDDEQGRELLANIVAVSEARDAAEALSTTLAADLAASRAVVARLTEITSKLTSGCPWDGPPCETAKILPTMPCPVCGDLGTFNTADQKPSRCVSNAQSRKEWREDIAARALKPKGAPDA